MTGIVEFVEARLAERQAIAEAATRGPWERVEVDGYDGYEIRADQSPDGRPRTEYRWVSNHVYDHADADHIALNDPVAVLADIKAKRRMIDAEFNYAARIDGEWGCSHAAAEIRAGECRGGPDAYPEDFPILRALAGTHPTHPDFRPEWDVDA